MSAARSEARSAALVFLDPGAPHARKVIGAEKETRERSTASRIRRAVIAVGREDGSRVMLGGGGRAGKVVRGKEQAGLAMAAISRGCALCQQRGGHCLLHEQGRTDAC